jgi:cathepsin C
MCGYQQPDKNEHHFNGMYSYALKTESTVSVELAAPNVATADKLGGKGTWTMVYDEGFWVKIADSEFFAFHAYKPKKGTVLSNLKPENYISFCDKTLVGWYHKGAKYGCWRGSLKKPAYPNAKITNATANSAEVTTAVVAPVSFIEKSLDSLFDPDYSLIEMTNSDPESLWRAKVHEPFLSMTERDMLNLVGGRSYPKSQLPRASASTPVSAVDESLFASYAAEEETVFIEELAELTKSAAAKSKKPASLVEAEADADAQAEAELDEELEGEVDEDSDADEDVDNSEKSVLSSLGKKKSSDGKTCEYGLPCALDWRNHKGHNWLSNIRNQGSCGSCYAMAFTTVLETRVRIKMNQPKRHRYSTQHVVSCSQMNQGCRGGFPELVGMHIEQLGAVPESCFPYEAKDGVCSRACKDKPEFPISGTRYVGGYLGATSEEKMMKEIAEGGPIVVAFEAPRGLFSYHGGIFTGPKPRAENQGVASLPLWQHTNHAIVAVGWGHTMVNGVRHKYWLMRNTWGKHWGEDGYFRIRRGTDECGIESMSVSFDVKEKF